MRWRAASPRRYVSPKRQELVWLGSHAALVIAALGCGLIEIIHQVHRRHVARVLAAAGA